MNADPAGPAAPRRADSEGPIAARAAVAQRARTTPRQVDSHSLLQGRNTLIIAHQGELYRLQLTRQGKLILTK